MLGPFQILTFALFSAVAISCLFVILMRQFGPLVVASSIYGEPIPTLGSNSL